MMARKKTLRELMSYGVPEFTADVRFEILNAKDPAAKAIALLKSKKITPDDVVSAHILTDYQLNLFILRCMEQVECAMDIYASGYISQHAKEIIAEKRLSICGLDRKKQIESLFKETQGEVADLEELGTSESDLIASLLRELICCLVHTDEPYLAYETCFLPYEILSPENKRSYIKARFDYMIKVLEYEEKPEEKESLDKFVSHKTDLFLGKEQEKAIDKRIPQGVPKQKALPVDRAVPKKKKMSLKELIKERKKGSSW